MISYLTENESLKSAYCEFTSGLLKRHNGKISESLNDFRAILKTNENANNRLETLQAKAFEIQIDRKEIICLR